MRRRATTHPTPASGRPTIYKRQFSHEEAQETILADSGIQFDPEVIDVFMAKREEFIRVARMFADQQAPAGES